MINDLWSSYSVNDESIIQQMNYTRTSRRYLEQIPLADYLTKKKISYSILLYKTSRETGRERDSYMNHTIYGDCFL